MQILCDYFPDIFYFTLECIYLMTVYFYFTYYIGYIIAHMCTFHFLNWSYRQNLDQKSQKYLFF